IRFARILKSKGIHIITIGVGKLIDKNELTRVASSPNSTFFTASYDVLEYIKSDLVAYTCAG
ncbi:unnamed protein product, partial [Candidula unifasciata]